jgi:hypothetical protein
MNQRHGQVDGGLQATWTTGAAASRWCTSARGHRCSPTVADEDEQDKAVLKGSSSEHKQRHRGGVTMVKSSGDLSSV